MVVGIAFLVGNLPARAPSTCRHTHNAYFIAIHVQTTVGYCVLRTTVGLREA
jgi:hypothetical protein